MHEGEQKQLARKLVVSAYIRGLQTQLVVTDLSAHGCTVEASDVSVHGGEYLILHLTSERELVGRVQWRAGRQAGVEFDEKLKPDVGELLGIAVPCVSVGALSA
jgi:hypothetical protein